MTTPAKFCNDRARLAAINQELQTNRLILDGLMDGYRMFRFTGGVVPTDPWCLAALTAYLQCPFAADRISTAATERYRHLAETIMALGQEVVAGGRPRTRRSRYEITARFDRDSSEIRGLGYSLESTVTKLAEEIL